MVRADASVYVWFLSKAHMYNCMYEYIQTYAAASNPAVTGSVFMQSLRLSLLLLKTYTQ